MLNERDQCKGKYRLSKTTLLSMLRSNSTTSVQPSDIVSYTDASHRTFRYKVVKVNSTTVELDANGTLIVVPKTSVQGNNTPILLDKLDIDDWSIISFDPLSRIACVAVNNGKSKSFLSIAVPTLG
jgi:hypothetical protein